MYIWLIFNFEILYPHLLFSLVNDSFITFFILTISVVFKYVFYNFFIIKLNGASYKIFDAYPSAISTFPL